MARKYRLSEKDRRARSKNMQRLRSDPAFMKMVKAAQKRLWQDPDYVARRSADMKRLFEDPEFRAKHAATHTKVNAEKRQQIVAAARTAPKLTLRQIAKAVGGVSHETVRKVLAEAKGAPRTRK